MGHDIPIRYEIVEATLLGHEAYKGMLTKLSRKAAEAILDHPVSNLTKRKNASHARWARDSRLSFAKVIDAVAATLFPYVLLQHHRRSRGSFRPRLQLLPIPCPLLRASPAEQLREHQHNLAT